MSTAARRLMLDTPIPMTIEILETQEVGGQSAQPARLLLPDPPPVRRTAAEKLRILARLTTALIELQKEERERNGNS